MRTGWTHANAAVLDFESNLSFTLTVRVTDNHGATDTANVTVNLTDVFENTAPQLAVNGPAVTWIKRQRPVNALPLVSVGTEGNLAGGVLTIALNAIGKRKSLDLLGLPGQNPLTETLFVFQRVE